MAKEENDGTRLVPSLSTADDIKSTVNAKILYSKENSLPKNIDENQRLDLAKKVLLCLFCFSVVIIVGGGLIILFRSPCADGSDSELVKYVNAILDLTKTIIPSMITLVLGFYFGRKEA